MYTEFATWWPLLSDPADYAEEAAFYADLIERVLDGSTHTVLELGCGGGNNAAHMKERFDLTLTDLSEDMLAVSRALNPECAHIPGDMRQLRLGRTFSAVFVHDAVSYMTTEGDLRAAMETAYVHCRPGGVTLFAPDYVQETFAPGAEQGGSDGAQGALRYLAWVFDEDPSDTVFTTDYAYMLRGPDGTVRVEHERHVEGLFPAATWLRLLGEVGFEAELEWFDHSEVERSLPLFVGRRPG